MTDCSSTFQNGPFFHTVCKFCCRQHTIYLPGKISDHISYIVVDVCMGSFSFVSWHGQQVAWPSLGLEHDLSRGLLACWLTLTVGRPGSAFIKPDQRNPWIMDQIKITLLPTISHLLLPNFVSCGRDCPSHMTQNLVTVGAKLWTADRFIVDP